MTYESCLRGDPLGADSDGLEATADSTTKATTAKNLSLWRRHVSSIRFFRKSDEKLSFE
jgi:hypothetical protein